MFMGNLGKKAGRLMLAVVLATTALSFGISTTAHAAADVKINMHGGAGLWFEFYFVTPDGDDYVVAIEGNTNGNLTLLDEGFLLDHVHVYLGGSSTAASAGYIPGSTMVSGGTLIEVIGAENIAHRNNKTAHLVDDGSLGNANSDGRRVVNTGNCNFWYRAGDINLGTEISLYAEKSVEGTTLANAAGLFKFYAYVADAAGNPVGAPIAEGTNDELGRISFEPVLHYSLSDAGQTFTYVIVEDTTPITNWILDNRSFIVTVEVDTYEENQTALLIALPTYNPETGIVFVNSLQGPPVPYLEAVLALFAKKSVVGIGLASVANVFQFGVFDEDESLVAAATNNASGNVVFPLISYDNEDVGIHVYTVREFDTDRTDWKYDKSVYRVTVEVTLIQPDDSDPEGFSLLVEIISIEKDGVEVDEIEFVNEIIPTEIPRTGDSSPWLFWGIGLFALVGITTLAVRQRKNIA